MHSCGPLRHVCLAVTEGGISEVLLGYTLGLHVF